jgi:alkylation response protein AidB-like acyl-CoA dehydrogenase
MESPPATRTDWIAVARDLAPAFAARAAAHDAEDRFVSENYADLKARRVFSAAVPAELGGGGAAYPELAAMLRELARACGSTALALSMHTHLLATAVWRLRQGQAVEPLLRRVAAEQIVLVSTGASDWLESSGRAVRVEGGYRVTGRKVFGSGSPAGTLLITSAVLEDPDAPDVVPTVLHFPVPLNAEGVTIKDTWRTMGMRATGSNDVLLENVFVPEAAVSLRRQRGAWHPFYEVVVTVAMPLIMSVYLGVAEAACDLALGMARKKSGDPNLPYLVGEMDNALVSAQLAVQSMVELAGDYGSTASIQTANAVLIRKTLAARACIEATEKALEVAGGGGFFRAAGLERLLRDVHGAQFHPLQEKRQHLFTGRLALGLAPAG